MKKENTANKLGLYGLAFERLKESSDKSDNSKVIPFPKVFSKLCAPFSIKKQLAWEILFIFRDCGLIEIIAGHGVRIKHD